MDEAPKETSKARKYAPLSTSGRLALLGGVLYVVILILQQALRIQSGMAESDSLGTKMVWATTISAVASATLIFGVIHLFQAPHRKRDKALENLYPGAWRFMLGTDPAVRIALKGLGAPSVRGLSFFQSVIALPDGLQFWEGGARPREVWAIPAADVHYIHEGIVQRSWQSVYAAVIGVRTEDGVVELPLALSRQARWGQPRLDKSQFDAAMLSLRQTLIPGDPSIG